MASSSSWMPPSGRHTVNIGTSLGRAIKNRKLKGSPAPTTKRSNLPERDFYSFKFKFKASSIDGSKPASIESTQLPDNNTQVRAEYPSTQAGEVHKFSGTEQPAKDVECILIYDEETGQYTLEKLDSSVQFKYDGKGPEPASANKGKARQEDSETSSPFEDSIKAEEENNLEEIMQQAVSLRREEEEGEGEEVDPPRPPSPVPPPKPARPVKSLPKSRAEQTPKTQMPPPTTAAPPQPVKVTPAKAKKVEPVVPVSASAPLSYPDEEVIEFGKPAKRARSSPPPRQLPPPPRAASPVSLSLPGGSTPAFAPLPAPVVHKATVSRNILPSTQPPSMEVPASPPAVAQSDSEDDEEDWEQVSTAAPVIPQPDYEAQLEEDIFGDGFAEGTEDADGGEDIDANDFEQMMNEQMEPDSEDDFLAAAVSPEPTRQPISLNRLASGGAAVDSDEDDFSSSDDSDED